MPKVRIIKEQRKVSKESLLFASVIAVSMILFVVLAGFLLIQMVV